MATKYIHSKHETEEDAIKLKDWLNEVLIKKGVEGNGLYSVSGKNVTSNNVTEYAALKGEAKSFAHLAKLVDKHKLCVQGVGLCTHKGFENYYARYGFWDGGFIDLNKEKMF